MQFPYDIVVMGLVVVILALFGAAFFFMRELRLRTMPLPHGQSDLTNMMILFQTMRDILSQQKDLAREFNISIDKKVGEVRALIESSSSVRADLEQAKREISALSTQTRKELASLERRLMQVDGGAPKLAEVDPPDPEEISASAVDAVEVEDVDVAADLEEIPEADPKVEEILDAPAATEVEPEPLNVFPVEPEEEDDFLSKWAGSSYSDSDEYEEDDAEEDPIEAAHDAVQTRDALRDLLDLQTVTESNGGRTSSTEVLNSGGNGGRYLTPIQKRVYEYSDAGMRVPEIARELGVGKGEIRLILSLRRDRTR